MLARRLLRSRNLSDGLQDAVARVEAILERMGRG
jgi:hypothetical protein